MIYLGVNIDHIATLRQARGTRYPEPLLAAKQAEMAGADGITMHLREDRRHIQDRDVRMVQDMLDTKLNLEMAITPEMTDIACELKPEDCCLVPERRAELTTEGGLDVARNEDRVAEAVSRLSAAGIRVSLFVDADIRQIEAAVRCAAPVIEIHTGHFADAVTSDQQRDELSRIERAVHTGVEMGLQVNAGHGLHYHNVQHIAAIPGITELNIGHAIIARALFTGLHSAVADMKRLMVEAVTRS